MNDTYIEVIPNHDVTYWIDGQQLKPEISRIWRKVYWFIPGVYALAYSRWIHDDVATIPNGIPTGKQIAFVYPTGSAE